MRLNNDEKKRYARQLMIPEFAEEAQIKLKQASVFIAGAGGLGSVSAYYLAAAGVGRLKIVDRDLVDLSNLNRQIIHWTDDIGRPKALSASEKVSRLNPLVHVEPIHADIDEKNIRGLVGGSSLILDATDNLATRRLLNKVSLEKRIPFILGGIETFHGMVTSFIPGESCCFDCLFPQDRFPEEYEGVINALPGIVASIQVLEAMKFLAGMPLALTGRLLMIDGVTLTFNEIRVDRDPNCKACGHSS